MNQEHITTEKREGKHLCLWERQEIEKALRRGASMGSIAQMLGRNKSTISREIKRGLVLQREAKKYISSSPADKGYIEKRKYFAEAGQSLALKNTGRRGGKYKLFEDPELVRYIEEKILKDKWSPAAVIGWVREGGYNFKTMVCFKTVYNYIDRNLLAVKNIDLLFKVRLKSKKRQIRKQKRVLGKSIEMRPVEVNTREEFGHWEGDTIIGKGGKSAILTLVERKTRKGFMLSLKGRSAFAVTEAFKTLTENLNGLNVFKSITFDNGSEFADCSKWHKIEAYFAHPYSAWERGTNENYNGIIRRFIPKGKDLSLLNQATLNRINNMIDALPRKRLNYKTSEMLFEQELKNLYSYPAG